MGVILKYQIDFPDSGITVSNNILAGGFLLDAEATIEMIRGTSASTFEIRLIDLPVDKNKVLNDALKTPQKHVKVQLGYSELFAPFDVVVQGVMDSVRAVVQADKLVTIVKGTETATYVLQKCKYKQSFDAQTPITDVVKKLIDTMTPPDGEQKPGAVVDDSITDKLPAAVTFSSDNKTSLIQLLQRLADAAQAQLFVGDGKVYFGKPIKRTDLDKVTFQRSVDLAVFESFTKSLPDDSSSNFVQTTPAAQVNGFTFTVAGNPKLRPGQQVSSDVDDFSAEEFRIHSVQHKLSMTDGYSCKGQANKITGTPADSSNKDVQQGTPDGLATGISTLAKAAASSTTVVEVGQVKEYVTTPANRVSLYYGQKVERPETQPSVGTPVQNDDQQVAKARPIISPFAFNKCGLITPVFKGMKAVMVHNRSLDQDSMVAGYLWSDQPSIAPPANKQGDWWLCLPSDYTDDSPPSDSTKCSNDLTAVDGKRVIQVKGLKIMVGADLQTAVGTRPDTGDDDVFLIQHKKASIKIANDGSLEIFADAQGQKGKITVSSSGDISMSATGGVTLKVGASGVSIS